MGTQGKTTGKGIGFSLVGLVLVAVLPMLVFGTVVAWMIIDQKKDAVAEELAGTARALRVTVDRELFGQFAGMEVLASDPSLDSADLTLFRNRARQVLKANTDWLAVALIDPRTHRIIAGAPSGPPPSPTSLSPVGVNQVVTTGRPLIVGAFASGKISREPILLLLAPVIRERKIPYVLGIAMNPKTLSNIFTEQRLAASWTGAVVDNHLTIAGRSRDQGRYVGVRATESVAGRINASASGMFTAFNQEGTKTYTVFNRSELTGWSVVLGVPAAEVDGPIQRTLWRLVTTGGTLMAFALILTGLVGRVIVRRRNAYEIALTESESRFRLMADSAPVFIWISDTEGRCTWVNQAMLDFTGHTREQAIGNGWAQTLHPDDVARCTETYAGAFESRQPFSTVFRLAREDGQYRWILDKGIPRYEKNVFVGYIGSGTDITERKEVESALQESEKRYRTLFSNAGAGIFIMSADGKMVEVNESFARMHGYSVQEMEGMNIRDLDTPKSAREVPERMRRILAGESMTFEVEHHHRNGQVVPLEAFGSRISFGDESCVLCLHTDIAERKRSEQKIRRLTSLYAALSECSQAIVHCRNKEDLFAQICRDVVEIGGMRLAWIGLLDPETGLVRVVADCGEGLEHLQEMIISADGGSPYGRGPTGTAVREGRPYWCQDFQHDEATELWRKRGRSFNAEWKASASLPLFSEGTTIGAFTLYSGEINAFDEAERSLLVEMSMNVSYALDNFLREAARKETEEALLHSRMFLDSLVEQSPMNMWVSDDKGTLLRANQALRDQFRVSDDELVGKYNIFRDPLVEEQGFMPLVRQVFDQGVTARFTIVYDPSRLTDLKLENGAEVVLEVTISPIFDASGKVTNAIVQHMDISELKRMERDLKEAKSAAESANRAKSAFLANMSHEIRTPMNGIVGMSTLLGYTDLSEEQRDYLDAICVSSDNLLSLINDVLDLSKIEAGKFELEQHDFSLRSCIAEVVRIQVPFADAKGLGIGTEIAAELPDQLRGDQLRLKQILLNLVGNAVKFTVQGSVTVKAGIIERTGDRAVFLISVADTGIGIAPDAMERIFAPFTQADVSTSRKHGGTGLGLSICAKLAGLMGGTIWAESAPELGSTFHVALPFQYAGAPQPKRVVTGRRPPGPDGRPLRILLVDDDEINRSFAMQILKRRGHDVETARNGREAVEHWENNTLDLILMDVQMPVMDGIEATRRIRERETAEGGALPIIALTANALKGVQESLLAQGFTGYVSKPIDVDILLDALNQAAARGVPDA